MSKRELRLEPWGRNRYRLIGRGEERVAAVVYLAPVLLQQLVEEEALKQLADAASLPGVVEPVIGLPDIHTGFGLPIGGVMATDWETGVVSAGAVGMDINCGVRLLRTNLKADELSRSQLRQLLIAIEKRIPAGVGKKSKRPELRHPDLEAVAGLGARYFIEQGYGYGEDGEAIEAGGCLPGADLGAVSRAAIDRADQLATIGGGNHFIELGRVERVYPTVPSPGGEAAGRPDPAELIGLQEGHLTVLIHTGSRGFGHQICTDYSSLMAQASEKYGIKAPTKGLACAPIDSPEGREYLAAMACAANFAFANRQLIAHGVREAFGEVLGLPLSEIGLELVYDVAHNIAKVEEHRGRKLLVHRKGATRALPPGHGENPKRYLATGHPAIIPGSMGTASYVVLGTPAIGETFNSVNHGAGRVMSRRQARSTVSEGELAALLGPVLVNARNLKTLADEAPSAYKDIDAVVNTLVECGLTRPVARLVPLAVIKGEGDEA